MQQVRAGHGVRSCRQSKHKSDGSERSIAGNWCAQWHVPGLYVQILLEPSSGKGVHLGMKSSYGGITQGKVRCVYDSGKQNAPQLYAWPKQNIVIVSSVNGAGRYWPEKKHMARFTTVHDRESLRGLIISPLQNKWFLKPRSTISTGMRRRNASEELLSLI